VNYTIGNSLDDLIYHFQPISRYSSARQNY